MKVLELLICTATWAILQSAPAKGSALPSVLAEGRSTDPQTIAKCGVSETDPDVWQKSNASTYLKTWLEQHGPSDWLHKMDLATTDSGLQGSSSLLCDQFPTGACLGPTIPCRDFTPPEFYYIRFAAANFYSYFLAIRDGLSLKIMDNSLHIDDIMNDFTPPPQKAWGFWGYLLALYLGAVRTPLNHAEAWVADIGSEVYAALMTMKTSADLAAETPPSFPESGLKVELSNYWNRERQHLETTARNLFKGQNVPIVDPGAAGLRVRRSEQEDASAIVNTFSSGGWFLIGNKLQQLSSEAIDSFGRLLTKYTVVQALIANNINFFQHTLTKRGASVITQNECFKFWDARWLTFTGVNKPGWPSTVTVCARLGTSSDGQHDSVNFKPYDTKRVSVMYTKYGISLEELYINAFDCYLFGHDRKLEEQTLVGDAQLPRCLYPLQFTSGYTM